MKHNKLFKLYYIVVLLVVLANSILFIKNNFTFDINELPEGEYQYSLSSPDNLCTLAVYKVSNSLGTAVRIEETSNNKTHNIFWQTDIEDVNLQWNGNDVVILNDVPINIKLGGYYDCRRGTSIMTEGSIAPEMQSK